MANNINDTYLKTSGDEEGIASYDQVADLLVNSDMSYEQMAEALGNSKRTVEWTGRQIFATLEVGSRADLVKKLKGKRLL